jgi:hypothetical protein
MYRVISSSDPYFRKEKGRGYNRSERGMVGNGKGDHKVGGVGRMDKGKALIVK